MKRRENNGSELNQAAKASAALVIASFLQKGMAIISVPLFTRLMTTGEYGTYSVYVSWIEVLAIFSTLCLSRGVYNNGLLRYENDRECFTFSLCVLSTISTLLVMVAVSIINILFPSVFHFEAYMLIVMGMTLLGEPAYNMWRVRQRFEYRYKMQTFVSLALAVSSTVSALLFLLFMKGDGVRSRILGYYLVVIAFQFAFYAIHARRANLSINTEYWRYALRFNLPLIPHYLSLYVLNHFDRIMIDAMLGSSEAALYTLAYQLGSAITILWTSINASLIPYTYERCRKREFVRLNDITIFILIAYACVCFIVMLFAPEAMIILAPSAYGGAVKLVPIIVAGVFCSSIYYIFANVVYYYEKPKYVMLASIISASVNLVLNYRLIPRFGISAAAFSTLLCYLIQAAIDYWAMKHVLSDDIYSMRVIVLLILVVISMSILVQYMYSSFIIRLILLCVFFVLFYINRNRVTDTFKKLRK